MDWYSASDDRALALDCLSGRKKERKLEALKEETKMKKTSSSLPKVSTLAFALLFFIPSMTRAQTTQKFEPKQLQEDFQIARQSLEEGQSGLYRYTKKADL